MIGPGHRLGDYEVLAQLGVGGMGSVYKVRNVLSGRVEAMKLLRESLEEFPEAKERFLREIRVLAQLEHKNIAAFRTAQSIDGKLALVMEMVEGESLQAVLQRGAMPHGQAIQAVAEVLEALDYAHAHGVVHRDIKPSNICLQPTGTVKLLDFGIARLASERQLTRTGTTTGSLHYMSPEQIEGGAIDARSDIYSLGATLYEMVTGSRPYDGDSDYAIMAGHLHLDPTPPRQRAPQLPPALNDIILMAIEKDPAKRFQSAAAMRGALLSIGAAPAPSAKPVTAPAPPRSDNRRLLYLAAGSVATVAVLIAAASFGPRLWQTEAQQPEAQQKQPDLAPPPTTQPELSTPKPTAVQTPAPTTVRSANPAPAATTPVRTEPLPQPEPATPTATAPTPQQQPEPAKPPAGEPEALKDARDRFAKTAAKVRALRQSLELLQQAQARMGFGLRRDAVEARERAFHSMDEAEQAVRGGDPAAANKLLDAADRDLAVLEKILGR